MSYAQLDANLVLRFDSFEKSLGTAEDLMRNFVGADWKVPLRLDPREFNEGVRQLKTAMASWGKLSVPVEMNLKVNGQNVMVEGLKAVSNQAKKMAGEVDGQVSKVEAILQRMKRSGARFDFPDKIVDFGPKQLEDLTAWRTQFKALRKEAAQAGEGARKAFEDAMKSAKSGGAYGNLGEVNWEGWHKLQGEIRSAIAAEKEAEAQAKRVNDAMAAMHKEIGQGIQVLDERHLKEAEADLKRSNDLIQKTARDAASIGAAMQKNEEATKRAAFGVGKAVDGIDAKVRKLDSNAQKSAKDTASTGNAFTKFGGQVMNTISRWAIGYTVVSTLISGIETLTHALFAYNAEIQVADVSMTSMLGGNKKAADELLHSLQMFAIHTPMQFEDWLPFLPQLKIAGVATKDMIPTLKAFGDAAAAASIKTGSLKENMTAIVHDAVTMATKGKVTGMETKDFATHGIPIRKYLMEAYSSILPKNVKEAQLAMDDLIHKGLIPADIALKVVTERLEHDPLRVGMMEKQGKTFQTTLTNIKDAFNAVVGGAFKPEFDKLSEGLYRLVQVAMAPSVQKAATDAMTKLIGALEWLGRTALWVGGQAVDKLPYVITLLAFLGSAKLITGIATLGNTMVVAFGEAAGPIGWAVLVLMAFIAAYRQFPIVQDVTDAVVGSVLIGFKGLTEGFWWVDGQISAFIKRMGDLLVATQRFTPAISTAMNAVVPGSGAALTALSAFADSIQKFGADSLKDAHAQQNGADAFFDGLLTGWINTGSKKFKAFMTSDFGDLLGINALKAQIDKELGKTMGSAPLPPPKQYTELNTGKGKNKQAAADLKLLKEHLGKLARAYDEAGKAAEQSGRRQLSALTKVRDLLRDIFGSVQDDLAKYGVLSSPLDAIVAKIEKIANIGPRMAGVMKGTIAATEAAQKGAEGARARLDVLNNPLTLGKGAVAGPLGADNATTAQNAQKMRTFTTFTTRNHMEWSAQFEALAKQNKKVQEVAACEYGGNWNRFFEAMGAHYKSQQRLINLARPHTSEQHDEFRNPKQWSQARYVALSDRFKMQARMALAPQGDAASYERLVDAKAMLLAKEYLRKIGAVVTIETGTSGYQKGFDLGKLVTTQTRHTQQVPDTRAGVQAPTLEGATSDAGANVAAHILEMHRKGIAASFVHQCERLAHSNYDEAGVHTYDRIFSGAGSALGAMHRFQNAGIGQKYVPGMALSSGGLLYSDTMGHGSGHVQSVGPDGARYDQYGRDKFRESNFQWYVPPPGALTHAANLGTPTPKGGALPDFAASAGGLGNAATLGAQKDGQSVVSEMLGLLNDLKLTKLSPLPKSWGAAVKEGADTTARFKVQMLLANTAMQEQFKALKGEKAFEQIAGQLRNYANAADALVGRLKALATVSKDIREIDAKSRALGRGNDPFLALEERRRAGGDLFYSPDLSTMQKQSMEKRASELEARVKTATRNGTVKPDGHVNDLANQAGDLRRQIEESDALHLLSAKTLHLALDEQTTAIKQNVRALQDRKLVLQAGAKFVTASTYDEYKYARAVELRGKEVEYWNTNEVKAMAKRASALEALARANTLAKGAQGPVNPDVDAAGALATAHGIRRTLNANASWAAKSAASGYDYEKAVARTVDWSKSNNDLRERLVQLKAQAQLAGNASLSEGELNLALEKQGYYFEQLKRLRDPSLGFTDERSRQLAAQLTAQNAVNEAVARGIAQTRALNVQVAEMNAQFANNAVVRAVYANTKGGSVQQTRSLFAAQTRADLEDKRKKGDALVPDLRAVSVQYGIEMSKYDDKARTDRAGELSVKLGGLQNDLLLKQSELQRGLSEVAKQELDWKIAGVVPDLQELRIRQDILDTLKQTDDLKVQSWQKDQKRQNILDGIFDPKKRADQQFVFDKADAGWSDAQISKMLPVDQMNRKLREGFAQMQGLLDDWKGSWSSMWEDMGTKGKFSLNSMLDNMTNRLIKWGADLIASKTWDLLTNLLTSFTGALIGGQKSAIPTTTGISGAISAGITGKGGLFGGDTMGGGFSLHGSHASGLDWVPFDNYRAQLHRGEAVLTAQENRDYQMQQAARDLALSGARASSGNSGDGASNGNGDLHFHGDVILPNVRHERDMPSATRAMAQGQARNSRRTNARQAQLIVGGGV